LFNLRHDERFAVRGDGHAVRGIGSFRDRGLPGRQIRILDAIDFLARRKVDDREPVEPGQLHEDPFRRAVGIRVERHRPDAEIHLEGPGWLFSLRVNHN
jgi:hypothetical protein